MLRLSIGDLPSPATSQLLLRGKIDERDGKEIEVRTTGCPDDYKSYCYVLQRGTSFGAVELEAYKNELDAREGHLRWLRRRERCLSYLEALGIICHNGHLWS